MIEVRRVAEGDPLDFEVVIREGGGETRHHVTMPRQMCDRLTAGKHTPECCLEAAFRFLLEMHTGSLFRYAGVSFHRLRTSQ
jgi:hypothetical protein